MYQYQIILFQASAIPWKHILTSLPMSAIFVGSFCRNWIFSMLLTEIPTYLQDSFHHLSIFEVRGFKIIWMSLTKQKTSQHKNPNKISKCFVYMPFSPSLLHICLSLWWLRLWHSVDCCTPIFEILTYNVCLFCSYIVVNIMVLDETVMQVRGLVSYEIRF